MYTPLHIDSDTERTAAQPCGRLESFLKWLHQYVPYRIYYRPPFGRASVEHQLASRQSFPERDWSNYHHSIDFVRRILEVITGSMNLPNANIVPDDPIRLVFTEAYDDFQYIDALDNLNKTMGTNIAFAELRRMYQDNLTMGDFMNYVAAMAKLR